MRRVCCRTRTSTGTRTRHGMWLRPTCPATPRNVDPIQHGVRAACLVVVAMTGWVWKNRGVVDRQNASDGRHCSIVARQDAIAGQHCDVAAPKNVIAGQQCGVPTSKNVFAGQHCDVATSKSVIAGQHRCVNAAQRCCAMESSHAAIGQPSDARTQSIFVRRPSRYSPRHRMIIVARRRLTR